MKLRIRGNSIRLRLLQTEVTTLAETGTISEKISFGGSDLAYTIFSSATSIGALEVSAQFSDNEIKIFVPENIVSEWANSGQVSIGQNQNVDKDGSVLKILIEKDFVCLDRKDDPDNADAFPHPSANC